LRQMSLVEPDDLLLDPGSVDDDTFDDLEIPPPRRPYPDARQLAANCRLLSNGEVGEAPGLVPVQVGAWNVLDQVANRPDPERGQAVGDPRAHAGKGLHRPLLDVHPPRLRRALVHASKAGQRRARTHGEGQDPWSIRPGPDVNACRPGA